MIKLDSIDKKILKLLYEDGRASASYIADEVKLSVPAVTDRIKKLQDSGVILGFKPIISSKKINLDITAFITVYSESSKNFEKVVSNAEINNNSILSNHSYTSLSTFMRLDNIKNRRITCHIIANYVVIFVGDTITVSKVEENIT